MNSNNDKLKILDSLKHITHTEEHAKNGYTPENKA